MRDESQNALLKTLEEPPEFVHLILLSSEPEALLETIASRCQPVDFAPLPAEAVEAALAGEPATPDEVAAAARLSAGDLERARFLLSDARPRAPRRGRALRRGRARRRGASAPWQRAARSAPRRPARRPKRRPARRSRRKPRPGSSARARDIADEAKRAGRRRRTESSTSASSSAPPGSATSPRSPPAPRRSSSTATASTELRAAGRGPRPAAARRAAELVQDTRRRLDLNVSEELALEALFFRLERFGSARCRSRLSAPARGPSPAPAPGPGG